MKKFLKYCFNTAAWQPSKVEWLQLLSAISKEERDKVTRFMFKRNAKQTLIGRVLIRYCLNSLLNIEWSSLCIGQTAKERPYLKIKETSCLARLGTFQYHVDFNVSHAGDYTVIFAGAQSLNDKRSADGELDDLFKLGADVMKIEVSEKTRANNPDDSEEAVYQKELNSHDRVINSKFSNAEKQFIYNKLSPVEKLSAFYRLWCLKESFVKALGEGVGFDLKRIEAVPSSELFIDFNSKKHLVAMDTCVYVDSKLVKTCKFYEQYFTNNLGNRDPNVKTQLHIMTACVIEKEKSVSSADSSQAKTKMNEFVELNLEDLLSCIAKCSSLDVIDNSNDQEYEEYWSKYCQKAESPLVA